MKEIIIETNNPSNIKLIGTTKNEIYPLNLFNLNKYLLSFEMLMVKGDRR